MKNWILNLTKYSIGCAVLMCNAFISHAQPSDTDQELRNMIAELERNNTSLHALENSITAEKMSNRIGLNPEDPEIGINYLKPNPRLADHRLDYSITQELEFPTVYSWRRKIAGGLDKVLDHQYQVQRSQLISQILQTWLDWVYHKEIDNVLENQHSHAQQLVDAYQRSFQAGSISILERNKARIHAVNVQKSLELNRIELTAASNQLLRLNGGQPLVALPAAYPSWTLPASLQDWLQEASGQQAGLQLLSAELEVHQQEQSLAGAMQLPNLSIGYMREQDIEVDFRGLTLGMSVPLWHNRNRTRHSRLQQQAQESLIIDAQQQFELELQHQYQKAHALAQQIDELRSILEDSREPTLLRQALDLGQINLVDYLMELSMYYDLQEKQLQAEREYYLVQADMRKWLY